KAILKINELPMRLFAGGFPPRPKKCGPGETFKQCVSSTCAEATCQKPVVGPGCSYDCATGCYCDKGFFRNARKLCVRRNQCP
ncbi:secreted cysteine rich protein, putative, partial [Ixodes scapularis]